VRSTPAAPFSRGCRPASLLSLPSRRPIAALPRHVRARRPAMAAPWARSVRIAQLAIVVPGSVTPRESSSRVAVSQASVSHRRPCRRDAPARTGRCARRCRTSPPLAPLALFLVPSCATRGARPRPSPRYGRQRLRARLRRGAFRSAAGAPIRGVVAVPPTSRVSRVGGRTGSAEVVRLREDSERRSAWVVCMK
jgi:hypothetical protein